MAESQSSNIRKFTAGADLSSKDGYWVKRSGANVILATDGTIAGGEVIVGVIAKGGGNTSGKSVSVIVEGYAMVKCGGVLTRGTHSLLTCNASGETIAGTAADMILARWVDDGGDAAGADEDWIPVIVSIFPYVTGGIGGSTGATDNAALRANGAGGATAQNSILIIGDNGELAVNHASATLAVGAAAPNASAIAQFDSTTKGLAPPRMTAAEFAAIAAPLDGIIGYETDTDRLALWANGARVRLVPDDHIRLSVTVSAEAGGGAGANEVRLTVQLTDAFGANLAEVHRLQFRASMATMIEAVAADITITRITGSGVSTDAQAAIVVDTDATGLAVVDVLDVSGALSANVFVEIEILGAVSSAGVISTAPSNRARVLATLAYT